MGMKAVDTELKYGDNPCGQNNFGCSHFCFYKQSRGAYCACPPGHYLSAEKKSCKGNLIILVYIFIEESLRNYYAICYYALYLEKETI